MLSEKRDAPASLFSYPFLISKEDKQHERILDHHAVIPTRNLQGADLTGLPVGEKAVLELVPGRM